MTSRREATLEATQGQIDGCFSQLATRIGWHLWEIDLRFAPGLPGDHRNMLALIPLDVSIARESQPFEIRALDRMPASTAVLTRLGAPARSETLRAAQRHRRLPSESPQTAVAGVRCASPCDADCRGWDRESYFARQKPVAWGNKQAPARGRRRRDAQVRWHPCPHGHLHEPSEVISDF